MTYRELCLKICRRLGAECRERRHKLGLPLKTVALTLGVSHNTVWTFERGGLDGLGFYVLYKQFLDTEEAEQNGLSVD